MERLLQALATRSPRKLLLSLWVALLLLWLLAFFRPFEGVATAAAFSLVFGYPYALILGLPVGVVRPSIKSTARWLLLGFVGFALTLAIALPFYPKGYETPTNPQSAREWLELFFAMLSLAVLFPPFFLGAAALNDARRYMRQSPPSASFQNFLALYFGIMGGLLYAHRRVREVLHAA